MAVASTTRLARPANEATERQLLRRSAARTARISFTSRVSPATSRTSTLTSTSVKSETTLLLLNVRKGVTPKN